MSHVSKYAAVVNTTEPMLGFQIWGGGIHLYSNKFSVSFLHSEARNFWGEGGKAWSAAPLTRPLYNVVAIPWQL